MLKRYIWVFAAVLLTVSCGKRAFRTDHYTDERCYELTFDDELWGEDGVIGLKASYDVVWPAKGLLDEAAERELMFLTFDDSSAHSMQEAAEQWITSTFFYEEDQPQVRRVDSLPDDDGWGVSYEHVQSTCQDFGTRVLFTISGESFGAGAAHGMYGVSYLTIDKESGRALHLTDFVGDTTQLGVLIARAVHELDTNREVLSCLFDEYRDTDRMPQPNTFFVDSARTALTIVYGLYEVAPYACGIQSVVLPFAWLDKQH